MAQYTLSQLRALIDATCFPPSASTATKTNLINKVREAFYFTTDTGGTNALWKGVITEQQLPVITQFVNQALYGNNNAPQTVTLSRSLSTLLKARDVNGPIDVRNEWVQFDQYAYGDRLLGDLGDGFCGVTDINPAGAQMKITTTAAEAGSLSISFTGTDSSRNALTEILNIPTTVGSVTTENTFYTVTEVVKSVTTNPVVVQQVTASVSTQFSRYDPGETFPSYRRYIYAFVTQQSTVLAKCKRNYVTLVGDNDPVEFGSVLAFEQALKSYRWFQNNDMASYRSGLIEAIGYLNGEQALYEGETAMGVVQMDMTTSPGMIANIL